MDNNQEHKKSYCTRCFLPINLEDKVDVKGQNFHRICSMCCVCRTIPTTLKMFNGHVFCNECFKTHVMTRFRGDYPNVQSNSWWMQWAPQRNEFENMDNTEDKSSHPASEPVKKFICARCLQPVDENRRVTIGEHSFHSQCGQCYICRKTPLEHVKIYYGQVFCEECFHRHILNRNKDNPSEFFKSCLEQWQNNAQFADNMRDFMAGSKESSPFIFMMQGQQPFCRCGTGPQEWFHPNEPKKSATPVTKPIEEKSYDLFFERKTDISDTNSTAKESANVQFAAEKIEKLTKYLHVINENELNSTNNDTWSFLHANALSPDICGWIDMQDKKISKSSECPKCLWQSGPIYVSNEFFRKVLEN